MRVGDLLAGSLLEDQIKLETEAIDRGVARYRMHAEEARLRGDAASLKPVERILLYWFLPLAEAIRKEQSSIACGAAGQHRAGAAPVLLTLDCERLAVIAIHETLGRCLASDRQVTVREITYGIGAAAVAEVQLRLLREQNPDSFRAMDRRFKSIRVARVNWWCNRHLEDPIWNRTLCTMIGAVTLRLLLELAMIPNPDDKDELVPAIEQRKFRRRGKIESVVEVTDMARNIIEDGHAYRQLLRPRYLPMIVPPYEWSEDQDGGYVRIRTPLIAKPTREQEKAIRGPGTGVFFEALNKVNGCAWTVNKRVLEVQEEIWERGGGIVGLPPSDPLPLPPRPSDIADNPESLRKWKNEAHGVHSENAKIRGARAEFLQRVSTARDLLQYERWYLPHQACFRTRLYPIPPDLNHHQEECGRALMLFANRRPITAAGERWIRIHAANCYGLDKAGFDDRIQWTIDNADLVEAVAERPIENLDGWRDADNPWLFLAACMGLTDADIGERLPVAVDGTANAWQHYAAMGRDTVGAKAVNLIIDPSRADCPSDPYSVALPSIVTRVQADADEGNAAAAVVLPIVTGKQARKTLKQPQMTRTYGCTPVGARLQVMRQLRRQGVEQGELFRAGDYLSKVAMDGISDICPSASKIQSWLETSARAMVKHSPTGSLRWTSPTGVPIIHPYRSKKKFQVRTILQEITLAHRDEEAPLALGKNVRAIAANLVHSIDAGHMQLSAVGSADADIEFAEVHDCFWTHASDMPVLNQILREQFVGMHSADLLASLHEEWSDRMTGLDLPPPPEGGDLDLTQILQSPYAFS